MADERDRCCMCGEAAKIKTPRFGYCADCAEWLARQIEELRLGRTNYYLAEFQPKARQLKADDKPERERKPDENR
jgi:hypothetical protein